MAHPGEVDLARLLRALDPVLDDEAWVFCALPGDQPPNVQLDAAVTVREPEGWTAVVPRARADAAGLAYHGVFRRVTLTVHSSLEAVGLLAAVARALAERGIACNAVSGFHHDHLFVPAARADEAAAVLAHLSTQAADGEVRTGSAVVDPVRHVEIPVADLDRAIDVHAPV